MDLDHIKDAIRRFIEQKNPGYAVMLDGAWGSGKTYFVGSEIKKAVEAAELKFSLVSLYGIRTEEQLSDSILESFLNIKGLSKEDIAQGTGLLGKLSKSISDASTDSIGLGTSIVSAFATAAKNRITNSIGRDVFIVFDDLERVTANPNEVLGWINNRVEHQGFRALIVCNEESLEKKRKITSKEKVVGFTYKFSPNNQYLIDASINALKERSAGEVSEKYYQALKHLLPEIAKEVKLTNIRTITHALTTINEVLNDYPDIVDNESRVQDLVGTALFYSIAYRDLLVPDSDLAQFAINPNDMSVQYHIRRHRQSEEDKAEKIPKWYKAFESMGDTLLSDVGYLSIWQLVRYGFLDKSRFNSEKACWRDATPTALHLIMQSPWTLSDEDLKQAFKEIREGIENNTLKFESYGELRQLLIKLRYLYKDEAIDIDAPGLDKLSLLAIEQLDDQSDINPQLGHLWEKDIAGDKYLEKYQALLSNKTRLQKSQKGRAELLQLLIHLLKGQPYSRDDIDNFFSMPGLDIEAAREILGEIPKSTPANLWEFGHALHTRYSKGSLLESSLQQDIKGVRYLKKEIAKITSPLPPSSTKAALRRIQRTLTDALPTKKPTPAKKGSS